MLVRKFNAALVNAFSDIFANLMRITPLDHVQSGPSIFDFRSDLERIEVGQCQERVHCEIQPRTDAPTKRLNFFLVSALAWRLLCSMSSAMAVGSILGYPTPADY